MNKYNTILYRPHFRSKKHPPMSRENRAAQFSSFAALSGYEDAVTETARLTTKKNSLMKIKNKKSTENLY